MMKPTGVACARAFPGTDSMDSIQLVPAGKRARLFSANFLQDRTTSMTTLTSTRADFVNGDDDGDEIFLTVIVNNYTPSGSTVVSVPGNGIVFTDGIRIKFSAFTNPSLPPDGIQGVSITYQ